MAAPTVYDVTIYVNGVDVTAYVPYDSMSFEDHATQVSWFRFTVENPSGVTPTRAHSVQVTANSLTGTPTIFLGLIIELETHKRDNGITTEYQIEAADQKIRLQKAIVSYNEFSGTDASILSSLLSNAYPDLSSFFDFSTDITSFMDNLDLIANDDSLLDLLGDLSELTDGGTYRFENPTGVSPVTFDSGGYTGYTLSSNNFGDSHAVAAVGNPGNAAQATVASAGFPGAALLTVQVTVPASSNVTRVTADVYATFDETDTWSVWVTGDAGGAAEYTTSFANADKGTWQSIDTSGDPDFPITTDYVRVIVRQNSSGYTNLDFRIDNIKVYIDGSVGSGTTNLQWSQTPDTTDFSIDIQSGDEFAFDIDLYEGDIDDFNSVTVIGGMTEETIDWTYESDGDMEHIDLETTVKSITVYKNTNTDASPTWTAQTDGLWGKAELTSDGGSADVLYDPDNHWLLFDSAPSNLSKSVRVTGTILKPLRLRVENISGSDPTFATVVHDDSITTQDQAFARGQSELDKRNSAKRLTFKTFEPGLKPGQSIAVADSARGLSETLVIQQISTRWLGASGHAEFTVECGNDDQSSADILIANNDKRSRQKALSAAITTSTASFLVDTDSTQLVDTDGEPFYEVT